jgi:hypothetical protein
MPIEIRELVIKTEISTGNGSSAKGVKEKELALFKKQMLEECKRLIADQAKKNTFKR